MYPPNEEMYRYPRPGADPYNSPAAGGSGSGGLTALLIIVVLLGGLIAYGSLSTPPTEAPTPAVETEAPDSIIGGGAAGRQ